MLAAMVSVVTSLMVYLSLLLVGFWIWFHWSHRDLLRVARKMPVSLPTIPLLGHVYLTFFSPEETSRRLLDMVDAMLRNGWRTICFWVGPMPLIVVGHIDDLQVIFNGGQNTADKPEEYDYFVNGLDSGLGRFRQNILTARGHVWKLTRKHVNPMFHPQSVQHMTHVFNANSKELVARMHEHVGQDSFNVLEYTMDLGLKTICNLVYGPKVPFDIHSESFKGLIKILEEIPELFVKRILKPWLRIDWIFQLLYRSQVKQINKHWTNFSSPHLKMAREKKIPKTIKDPLNEGDRGSTNENGELIDLLDAYSVLREKYPTFSEADMLCETLILCATGTDTVGSTTASCYLALANYQDIQERLYKEIISIVGFKDDIMLEDLARMPYLDQVIKETMRKYLTVPFVLRKLNRDMKLSDCSLPAGTTVVCSIASVHMNPELYPNPHEFDPDRFSPENSCGKEKFSFLPFSRGPRMCIAKTYAMNLMKIQIVHVLRNFRLSTSQDIENMKMKLVVTLVCTEGYNIRVERRDTDKNGLGSENIVPP